ncbi:MAG: alanine--tRNA ligase-related protein [Chthoniobacterales bacterium]
MAHVPAGSEIRSSFLEFFRGKQHTILPSSSLLPDSPNLLFTNAGMNQFVPIFLGNAKADLSRWPRAVAAADTRAADTQKCIRAGGKHNDLEDVGLDTYHHTFFEMLGNWSFGDYFKKEAIDWAWELLIERWKFPASRLYATVYSPGPGDPSEFDQEAWDHWAGHFRAAGHDPQVHIVPGNKKDNFWMMGETGPCGPCSELHIDLTPQGDTRGALVNKGTAECIEIWNLVFIQFNANPDGTFTPLPARHVDTGMGFERVCSVVQGTKGFTDFSQARVSNYETDVFRPLFAEIEKLSGKKYGSTLPEAGSTGHSEQEKIDIAFRVIADHARTLSFAVADGIVPGNNDRNYVLRRILRRAVRYGRTLGFHEPFFYKLTAVLARTMGEVFPELREKQAHVEQVLRGEEEAFNRTLDKGIALFETEADRLLQSVSGSTPASASSETRYTKRNLPHFERPWGKYMLTFSTRAKRQLSPSERDIVMGSILHGQSLGQYHVYAACVIPDHVHLLIEPQVESEDEEGRPVFHQLAKILHGIKSTTAHQINKAAGVSGEHVWEEESHDRLIRGEAHLQEKFSYICRNPWDGGVVGQDEDYAWLWTQEDAVSREGAGNHARGERGPRDRQQQISGAFAFKLYDEQGFPLDLTELMARERGLSVDTAGFDKLMDEQRSRARAAQKKQIITVSEIATKEPTRFTGFEEMSVATKVAEVVDLKGKLAVVLGASTCYAEMGGQVGDTGELRSGSNLWRIANTQKAGDVWLHLLESDDAPGAGTEVELFVDVPRRAAIQRHHTVTHLLHWALHEVVSREAVQKGSYVGPDKLTFDFSSAALTPEQVASVERLVNGKILANAPVGWSEVAYADVRGRGDVMQFFGDKYGDRVRVVQIGGQAGALDGYSMELCGGTHVRGTGEIGLFRITSEGAVAAGIRRIEAVAGEEARRAAESDRERLQSVAVKLGSPLTDLEKKLDAFLALQKETERALRSAKQREAVSVAAELAGQAETINGIPVVIADLGEADGDTLQSAADALKGKFGGVIVLGGVSHGAVSLVAAVGKDHTAKVAAGKLIQSIAPIVGGKGGGKPDNARGGGKDAAKLADALSAARDFVAKAGL